ncbi:hypothetical protein [Streptomyces sviceus]|uniref:hypothetical protein n=1 Tax=Streptomyces sviceus TaxID=285530 RepID=UPI0036EB3F72
MMDFLTADAWIIERKAKWANKVHHCLELQWPWLYPGFLAYTYWGKKNGCK